MTLAGFPHSGIRASTPTCGSARLIAAHHALLRLLAPRHPPSALGSLTTNFYWAPLRGALVGVLDGSFASALRPSAAVAVRLLARPFIGSSYPSGCSHPCGVESKVHLTR